MPGPATKHRVLYPLQQRVVNPIVSLAWELGIPIPGDALLKTTGRRTGRRRPARTPADPRPGQPRTPACLCTSQAVSTNLLTVRIDLDTH